MASLIRSASLAGYVDIARSSGLDAYRMMRAAGLSPSCLHDPEIRISVAAVRRLLESSANEGNIPDLGLRMAESRRLSNLGPVSLLLREEPTARKAVDLLLRHMRLLNQSLLTRLEEADGLVIIRHELDMGEAVSVRQAMELAVGVMYRTLKELLGPEWAPRRVCFTHAPPRSLVNHLRVFGRFVEFGCDFNGIVCSASDLEARNPSADPAMARYAQQYLHSLLAEPDATTTDRVRRLAHLLLPTHRCTVEAIAEQLGVDRRTIHRHLARDGTTFTEVLRGVRSEHAVRYLEDASRPMSEIADALGFSALSALSRWFKGEFGCSMKAWRRKHASPAQRALSRA